MAKTVKHINDLPHFGDESLLAIAGVRSFSSMIFELLSGKKPETGELKIFEAILNLSIDHGEETPSATITINSAQEGKNISEAIAAGIMQINDTHGGAIEPAMELLYKIKNESLNAKEVVEEYLKSDKRMPGFGHRIYAVDPRSELLFELAKKEELSEVFINIAKDLEKVLGNVKGKVLPINIDGSIAAILCTLGWDSNLGKAVFIIARTPGLCGQYLNAA